MSQDVPQFRGGRRILQVSLGLAAIGAVAVAVGVFVAPTRLMSSYLIAYAYVATTAVGALIFLMICNAMRAGWPVAVRRMLEAIIGALPLVALLFIPLVFGLDRLYPWLRPETITDEHTLHLLHHKAPYLNLTGFLARAAFYLVAWLVVGELLRRWSMRRDGDPSIDVSSKLQRLSAGALPLVGLALVFASFDWLMSLDFTWVSSMYPICVFGGGILSAIALLTVLTFSAQRAGLLPGVSESHYYALGRLLLAFTIFWAYVNFFQFMLIWMANHPHEVDYYLRRWEGPWSAVTVLVVATHFVIPFFVLLSYGLKRKPARLTAVAVWLLVAHYFDVHWLVVPEARAAHGFPYHWLDVAALLLVGGLSVAFATLRLRGKATMPVGDPVLPRALRYESL